MYCCMCGKKPVFKLGELDFCADCLKKQLDYPQYISLNIRGKMRGMK